MDLFYDTMNNNTDSIYNVACIIMIIVHTADWIEQCSDVENIFISYQLYTERKVWFKNDFKIQRDLIPGCYRLKTDYECGLNHGCDLNHTHFLLSND